MWKIINRFNFNNIHVRHLSVIWMSLTRSSVILTLVRSMSRVFIRSAEGEDRMQISLRIPTTNPNITDSSRQSKVFNFDRLKSEELEKTLSRISASLSKITNKKAKQGKNLIADSAGVTEVMDQRVHIALFQQGNLSGIPIDVAQSNEIAWTDGARLEIGSECYTVQLNIAFVKQLALPEIAMPGFVVRPRLVTEFADEDKCKIIWYKSKPDKRNSGDPRKSLPSSKPIAPTTDMKVVSDDESRSLNDGEKEQEGITSPLSNDSKSVCFSSWTQIHEGRSYVPTDMDVGYTLRIECIPTDGVRDGEVVSSLSKYAVKPCLARYPFEDRHKFTEKPSGIGCFRLVTYNILADLYADSDFSRDFLFPYCPAHALSIDYRKLLIIRELLGYNSDVICLQEVDKRVFEHDLAPSLEDVGYASLLRLKSGDTAEGSATFFRTSKFSLIARHDLPLTEALLTDSLFSDILDRVSKSPALHEKLVERTSYLQVTVLRSTEDIGKHVLVATIHLYFHPRAPHVRLIHTAVCLRHIERLVAEYAQQGIRPAVIFCGDLNSDPHTGLHEFITTQSVSSSHSDWFAGGKPELVDNMNLFHNLVLTSAYETLPYTNYVTGFRACIDYIYVEPVHVRTTRTVPLPSHEDVTRNTALPSVVFPSDHIALISDFEWIK